MQPFGDVTAIPRGAHQEKAVGRANRKTNDSNGHVEMETSTGKKTQTADPFDVFLLDARLPDGHELDVLPSFRAAPSEPEVITITGEGHPAGTEQGDKDFVSHTCGGRRQ